jgi:hypothetical protein
MNPLLDYIMCLQVWRMATRRVYIGHEIELVYVFSLKRLCYVYVLVFTRRLCTDTVVRCPRGERTLEAVYLHRGQAREQYISMTSSCHLRFENSPLQIISTTSRQNSLRTGMAESAEQRHVDDCMPFVAGDDMHLAYRTSDNNFATWEELVPSRERLERTC